MQGLYTDAVRHKPSGGGIQGRWRTLRIPVSQQNLTTPLESIFIVYALGWGMPRDVKSSRRMAIAAVRSSGVNMAAFGGRYVMRTVRRTEGAMWLGSRPVAVVKEYPTLKVKYSEDQCGGVGL